MSQHNAAMTNGMPIGGANDGLPKVSAGPVVIYPDQKFKKMTQEETSQLRKNIDVLSLEQKRGILKIVESNLKDHGDSRIEFELDKLPPETARELEKYVNDCVSLNIRKQKRKEADKKRRDNKRMEAEKKKQIDSMTNARQMGAGGNAQKMQV